MANSLNLSQASYIAQSFLSSVITYNPSVLYLPPTQSMRQYHPLHYILPYSSTTAHQNSYLIFQKLGTCYQNTLLRLQILTLLKLNYNHYCFNCIINVIVKPEHTGRADCSVIIQPSTN